MNTSLLAKLPRPKRFCLPQVAAQPRQRLPVQPLRTIPPILPQQQRSIGHSHRDGHRITKFGRHRKEVKVEYPPAQRSPLLPLPGGKKFAFVSRGWFWKHGAKKNTPAVTIGKRKRHKQLESFTYREIVKLKEILPELEKAWGEVAACREAEVAADRGVVVRNFEGPLGAFYSRTMQVQQNMNVGGQAGPAAYTVPQPGMEAQSQPPQQQQGSSDGGGKAGKGGAGKKKLCGCGLGAIVMGLMKAQTG